MNHSISRIRALLYTQLREFQRDFGTVFLNIIFPIAFVLALIVANLSNPRFEFKIGVVDERQEHGSQEFVQTLSATPGLHIRSLSHDRATAALKDGDVHAVFVIGDANFGADSGQIQTIVSPRYEAFARILLDAVRDRMDRELHGRKGAFDYEVRSPDVPVRSDLSFTFPGLLALALVQLGLFATAVPLLQARERGTLRYLSLTALTKGELLAGQFAMRVVLAAIQITLILLAGSTMMSFSAMQWVQVFGISLLGIALLVAMGYALAGMARNQQMGTAMILLTNFTLLMGGNVFMDPSGSAVQYAIACAIPVSYLADLYRQVISGETGLWPVWLDVLVIAGAAALAILIALRTFKFDTDLKATNAHA